MASIVPDPGNVTVEKVTSDDFGVVIHALSRQTEVKCPCCARPSRQRHSRYVRTIRDVAWGGQPVTIKLLVRKYFCETVGCPKWVFSEQLPKFAARYGRRTTRLENRIEDFGLSFGGNPTARLMAKTDGKVSRHSILRRVRRSSRASRPTPKKLGVDDFAFRKGRRYGTILVDLDTRKVVDLLEDRTKETLVTWLKEHPGVQVVTRDRAPGYAEAVREAAPKAKQVADRWHLLKNLGDALERLLIRRYASLKKTAALISGATAAVATKEKIADPTPSRAEKERLARRDRRFGRYRDVMERVQKGMGQRAVARELGLSRKTVARYTRAGEFPERAPRRTRSGLDPYRKFIAERWTQGCRNASAIWREIKEKGYGGGKVSVIQHCRLTFGGRKGAETGPPPVKPPSARTAMWQLTRPLKKLDADEAAFRKALIENDPDIAAATALAHRFQKMVKRRRRKDLAQWMDDARKSGISELAGFADGLEKDRVAVENGLSSKWSNGQTEGQVNRLKMLKRQMYGRANFDLLRLRAIHAE